MRDGQIADLPNGNGSPSQWSTEHVSRLARLRKTGGGDSRNCSSRRKGFHHESEDELGRKIAERGLGERGNELGREITVGRAREQEDQMGGEIAAGGPGINAFRFLIDESARRTGSNPSNELGTDPLKAMIGPDCRKATASHVPTRKRLAPLPVRQPRSRPNTTSVVQRVDLFTNSGQASHRSTEN